MKTTFLGLKYITKFILESRKVKNTKEQLNLLNNKLIQLSSKEYKSFLTG